MKFSGIYEEHPIGKEKWFLELVAEDGTYYLRAVDSLGDEISCGALLLIQKNGTIEKIMGVAPELGLTLDNQGRIVIGDE